MKLKIVVINKILVPLSEPEWVPKENISSGWEWTWGNPAPSCHLLDAWDSEVTASGTMGDCESLAGTGPAPLPYEPQPHPILPRKVTEENSKEYQEVSQLPQI